MATKSFGTAIKVFMMLRVSATLCPILKKRMLPEQFLIKTSVASE